MHLPLAASLLAAVAVLLALPAPASAAAFSAAEKTAIVAALNDYRRNTSPQAANMQLVTWDDAAEAVARPYAEACAWKHNSARGDFGENLAAGTVMDGLRAMENWDAEREDYTFVEGGSGTSTGVTGHFTQNNWATTNGVGCGYATCMATDEGFGWAQGFDPVTYVVCNYSPPGNYIGRAPWVSGAACSACPAAAPFCDDGLCSATDPGTGASPTPAAASPTPEAATTGGFTAAEKTAIVDALNDYRRDTTPQAANMQMVTWDDAAEAVAQPYAEACAWEHNSARGNFGENLAAGTVMDGLKALENWDAERDDFTFVEGQQGTSTGVTGHFTQNNWANSNGIGCGYASCMATDPGFEWAQGFDPVTFVVCNYSPPGNFNSQAPWVSGAACSACPASAPFCDDGLCSATDPSAGASPTPAPTPTPPSWHPSREPS